MTDITFINYRRDDSGAEAKLIADALHQSADPRTVFIDTESIEYGETWPDRIREMVLSARYVLIVIGSQWLHAGMNEWGQRRIDDKSDWVRQEIVLALKDNQKAVIPLLVGGAEMPPKEVLPDDISAISSKQAIEIRRDYWEHDIKLLTKALGIQSLNVEVRASLKNPLIDLFWDSLSPSLQDALALAANAARREGKDIVSTRALFAALRRLNPERLSKFFEEISEDALPEPTADEVQPDVNALSEIRLFSGCVQDSLDHLIPQASPDEKLTTEDIFIDIARHGKGESVHRLRTHGIDVSRINEIVEQLGWAVMDR